MFIYQYSKSFFFFFFLKHKTVSALCHYADHHDEESDEEGSASAAAGGDRTDLSDVGHHAFAHMAADQDNQRLEVLKGRTREETAAMEKQRR